MFCFLPPYQDAFPDMSIDFSDKSHVYTIIALYISGAGGFTL